jgi:hypothetical protein
MPIDPVVVLAEELRSTEMTMQTACDDKERETFTRLMAKTIVLYRELFETVPTSAIGAGELVRIAARHLPVSDAGYAAQMRQIADRLGSGQRLHTDLIWMRAMVKALDGGLCGEDGLKAGALLDLAVRGTAQPVLVYRAVEWIDAPIRVTGTDAV